MQFYWLWQLLSSSGASKPSDLPGRPQCQSLGKMPQPEMPCLTLGWPSLKLLGTSRHVPQMSKGQLSLWTIPISSFSGKWCRAVAAGRAGKENNFSSILCFFKYFSVTSLSEKVAFLIWIMIALAVSPFWSQRKGHFQPRLFLWAHG